MPTKTILVLANSVKKSPGRCIAGREIDLSGKGAKVGSWLRPVSSSGEGEEGELIPSRHCTLDSGGTPRVLDIVEVPLVGPRADPGQPENWEVVSGTPWKRVKRVSSANLGTLEESPKDLWIDGGPKTDRISEQAQLAKPSSPSLVLIRPGMFRVSMWTEYNDFKGYNQHKTRGIFTYSGVDYSLAITDDVFTSTHCPKHDGRRHDFRPPFGDDCLLCVSLGSPFNGYHYKLIAAVIPLK